MRKLIPALLLFAVACSGPKTDEYLIEGKIEGKVPAKAYLTQYHAGEFTKVDSSDFTNGNFVFKGSLDLPESFLIQIGEERRFISLFVQNANIEVTAHVDSLNDAKIVGSAVNDKYVAYKESGKAFDKEMEAVYVKFKAEEDAAAKKVLEAELDSIYDAKNEFAKTYVKENGNCVLAPYIISKELVYGLDLAELEELTNAVAPELKDSKYTQELFTRIELLRGLQPGEIAPAFTQNNPNGEPVSLSDFEGKYLLIDFWASWCGPCRRANPTIVEVFNKYNAKGFTILGVSMDSNEDKWLQAIEDDNLTWSHVSTLEGWANPVGKLYGVNSIPHAILIDPDGKIVKRGIHADKLDEILAEIMN